MKEHLYKTKGDVGNEKIYKVFSNMGTFRTNHNTIVYY
jgi:hypothetical protein